VIVGKKHCLHFYHSGFEYLLNRFVERRVCRFPAPKVLAKNGMDDAINRISRLEPNSASQIAAAINTPIKASMHPIALSFDILLHRLWAEVVGNARPELVHPCPHARPGILGKRRFDANVHA